MTQSIPLNSCQKKAADKFFRFLMSDDMFFAISGSAGFGKTYLANYISSTLMQTYEGACKLMNQEPKYTEVAFTATTNKAAEVLENSINKPVSTIHSFLGLKVYEDYKTGKTRLEKTINFKTRHNYVLFIDESSMIDSALLALIQEGFRDSKIVFIGDHAQMAPVGEDRSPIYDLVDEGSFATLFTPVRNAESPALMDLCKQLRNTVETGEFHYMQEVPGQIEYLSPEQMQSKLVDTFKEPTDQARILCYTNTRVQDYNAFLREVQGLPQHFVAGDELVVAQTHQIGKSTLNVERSILITKEFPELHSAEYAELTSDNKPIQYRKYGITLPLGMGTDIEVRIVTEPARLTEVIKKLARQKRWSEYFQLKGEFLDVRDKYACTVYKSQGSTYDEVFIDLGNIGTSHDAEQVARMLFVGVSRARSKVYFYGKLPGKYHGKVAA